MPPTDAASCDYETKLNRLWAHNIPPTTNAIILPRDVKYKVSPGFGFGFSVAWNPSKNLSRRLPNVRSGPVGPGT